MMTRLHFQFRWDQRANRIGSATEALPDLGVYNNPANAVPDFQRGFRTGVHAASRTKRATEWSLEDESFYVDAAIEQVPLSQSMSFAFLKGFAAGFRHAYRLRFRMR